MSTLDDFDRILAELAPPSSKPAAPVVAAPVTAATNVAATTPKASAPAPGPAKSAVAPPRPSVILEAPPVSVASPSRPAGGAPAISPSNADKIAELESMLLELGPSSRPSGSTSRPAVGGGSTTTTTTTSSFSSTPSAPASTFSSSSNTTSTSSGSGLAPPQNQSRPPRTASVSVSKPAPTASSGDMVICGKCAGQINGTYIAALEKNWHPEHFTCHSCNKALNGNFFETDKGILCTECASEQIRCSECGKPITGTHLIYSDGRPVHNECVPKSKCGRCNNNLSLGEAHVEALDKLWHPECFSCTRCMTPLGSTFVQYEGSPYCQACIQILSKERNIVFKT